MKKIWLVAAGFFFSLSALYSQSPDDININHIFGVAVRQEKGMIAHLPDTVHYPRSLNPDGSVRLVGPSDWTSGFFPGSLWYTYENTGMEPFLYNARRWSAAISSMRYNTGTHDLGFMFGCSFGNGYRLTGDTLYRDYMLEAAHSLASRFNPVVGCIRSWDFGNWQFPVIIDNMMNLELLFWAFHESGDSSYYKIAVSHARTTMKNHFRSDYSSWHVVDYDPETGAVLSKTTHQGASDSSDWARGQAWGLYGFVMTYRETGDTAFLQQAEHIANFILTWPGMPADLIPYWDYMAPGIPDAPRDASAAAITASALLELSRYDPADSARWFDGASSILTSLSSAGYMAKPGENGFFILKHSTGSKPSNSEVDVPVNWADYYFLEALTRYRGMVKTNNPPEILGGVPGRVFAGEADSVMIMGLDLDENDTVYLSLAGAPSFAVLHPAGQDSAWLVLHPEKDDIGEHIFLIRAEDRRGNISEQEVSLEVADPFWKNIRITASSWQDPNVPGNALDGDLNTRWSAEGEGQWIEFDLDTVLWLRSVSIAFYLGNTRNAYFTIEISTDGEHYDKVYYGTSSGTSLQLQEFVLGDTLQARYVKIVGSGNSQNMWNSYTEVTFGIVYYITGMQLHAMNEGSFMLRSFPSPASERLYVEYAPATAAPLLFTVHDLSGRLLLTRKISLTDPGKESLLVLDISSLDKGIYYLTATQAGKRRSGAFLKR